MKTALSYIRYSTKMQGKKNSENIDSEDIDSEDIQRQVISHLAQKFDCRIIKEYKDLAISGASIMNRPDLLRLMADLPTLKPDYLICQLQDRIARGDEFALVKIELKKHGINLITDVEGIIDLSDPFMDAMSDMMNVFAKLERRIMAIRFSQARRTAAINGQWRGKPPTGYFLKDGKLEIDPIFSPLVQWMFEEILKGRSRYSLVIELNHKGILTPKGIRWGYWAIDRILKNQVYTGKVSYKGEWFLGQHEALVSEEEFKQVQQLRRAPLGTFRGQKSPYLLTGFLYCGYCGSRLYLALRRNWYSVYECKEGRLGACRGLSVVKEKAERIVYQELAQKLSDLEELYEDELTKLEYESRKTREKKERLSKELSQIEAEMIQLENDYYDLTIIDRDQFVRRNRILMARKLDIKQQLSSLGSGNIKENLKEFLVENFEELWQSMDMLARRTCLQCAIDKIIVQPGKQRNRRLDIVWKI